MNKGMKTLNEDKISITHAFLLLQALIQHSPALPARLFAVQSLCYWDSPCPVSVYIKEEPGTEECQPSYPRVAVQRV